MNVEPYRCNHKIKVIAIIQYACAYDCFFLHFSTNLLSVPQGYPEGSHYSDHEGLSSPFISSGVAGKMVLNFLQIIILMLRQQLLDNFQNIPLFSFK